MDDYDTLELANAVLGLDEYNEDFDKAEELLDERFNVSLEDFGKIAQALMKFTPGVASPLTGTLYQGFVNGNFFIVKQELKR